MRSRMRTPPRWRTKHILLVDCQHAVGVARDNVVQPLSLASQCGFGSSDAQERLREPTARVVTGRVM